MERDLTTQKPELAQDQALMGESMPEAEEDSKPGFAGWTKGKLAALAIGAVGLGFGGNAVANADNTERATGPEATTSSKEMTPKQLKKLCKNAILKAPVITKRDNNILGRFAEKSRRTQGWYVNVKNPVVPAVCNGKYKRYQWERPEVQNPTKRKMWHPVLRPKWQFVKASNKGSVGNQNDPNYDVDYGSGDLNNTYKVDMYAKGKNRLRNYRCTPGPRKTGARLKIRTKVKDVENNRFIGGSINRYPTKVTPAC